MVPMILQDDAVYNWLQSWREVETEDTWISPVLSADEPLFDPDTPLKGLSHGSVWRSHISNYERVVYDDFSVSDEPVHGRGPHYRHTAQHHGLYLIINCDW